LVQLPWFTHRPPHTTDPAQSVNLTFQLGLDGVSLSLILLTTFLMIPSILISWTSIKERVAEFHALLLALATGMIGVFCSFDLILFYVFFEFTLLPMFLIIGIWGGPERRYAAPKFFVYTLAGSLLTLVGLVALILSLQKQDGLEVTTSLPQLGTRMHLQITACEHGTLGNERLRAQAPGELRAYWMQVQTWVFLAMFLGFAIKVPLVPFHTWLPLAHVEAPTAGSVLLAGILLKLGTYGFLRLCLPLVPFGVLQVGVPLVSCLATIGIIYGALCALAQDDIKRLVAYSSVSHLGFCMLGLFALNAEGMTGSVLQMINHGLSTGGLFLLVGMVYDRLHTRRLSDLGGLATRLPKLGFFMVFMCLSSIGLPGLNGFVGEVLCLMGMFKAAPVYAVFGTTGIILGAWYVLAMLQQAFFGPTKETAEHHEEVTDLNVREWLTLTPIALVCLWIGLYPRPVIELIKPGVERLERFYDKTVKPVYYLPETPHPEE
jgi:NADH-quinone oxidoreductase subunit M